MRELDLYNRNTVRKASGRPRLKARVLFVNGKTTQALLVWPHHSAPHGLKNIPRGEEKKGPPEKNYLGTVNLSQCRTKSHRSHPSSNWQRGQFPPHLNLHTRCYTFFLSCFYNVIYNYICLRTGELPYIFLLDHI